MDHQLKAGELLYEKIGRYLHDLIVGGRLKVGDRILAEREVARLFKASKVTARKAMQPLIAQGILEKIHGKGTFVKKVPGRAGATGQLGVVYSHTSDIFIGTSFYAAIIAGIEREAAKNGKRLVLQSLVSRTDTPPAILKSMEKSVDGFLLVDPSPTLMQEIGPALKTLTKPIIVLNQEATIPNVDQVVYDNYGGVKSLLSLLVRCGHRRIACLYWKENSPGPLSPNFTIRLRAFQDTLKEDGILAEAALQQELNYRVIDLREMNRRRGFVEKDLAIVRRMFFGPRPPTAVFCVSDEAALYFMSLAKSLGLRIPADVAVVGFDNTRESEMAEPPLTTVHTPLFDMGETAVRQLVARLEKPDIKPIKLMLPATVVERESHLQKKQPTKHARVLKP
jgi:DNA-binding LacI/PurR family transcriptional regulator